MNILDLWVSYRMTSRSPCPYQGTSETDNLKHNASFLVLMAFFRGMIGLICHLQQKELGHGAMDNPIYCFDIYYKFLWLLGPLSHRFVDCLLSWVLMSCCLNHCIITTLIHFLACPHSHSVCWLAIIIKEWKGTQLSEQTFSNVILEMDCNSAYFTL